jgi:type III restriction enzyme
LNTALIEIGIKAPKTVRHKSKFQDNTLSKNKNQDNIFSFKSAIIEQTHEVKLKTGFTSATQMFSYNTNAAENKESTNRILKLVDLGERLIRKAMQKIDFYNFDNLQNYLPDLQSTSEFIVSENYLGNVQINVFGTSSQLENLSPEQKLAVAIETLDKIAFTICGNH